MTRPGEQPVSILVVEDNPFDVELLRMALESAHFDCELTVVNDGAEALSLIRKEGKYTGTPTPDMAVLDLNVPKSDGLEILKAIRVSATFADVPVVVMSSSSSPRERANLEENGVDRYITKPPDLDEFLRIGVTLKELFLESRAQGRAAKT